MEEIIIMKIKKILKSAIIGASMLGLVGTAQAATEINLYGASAQYLFWNDAADDFLTAKGCTGIQQAEDAAGKSGITRGFGCTGLTGSPDVIIRYKSKASYDGIRAMQGIDPDNQCATEGPLYRPMADETQTDWTNGVVNGEKCVDVTLGASDVAGETFVQESHGQKKGHLGGGWIDMSFDGIDTTGLVAYQPLVVPFGFMVNNSVTIKRCVSPNPTEPTAAAHKAMSSWGNVCWDPNGTGNSDDCVGYYKCIGSLCSGGVNVDVACSVAKDCPDVNLADTQCKAVPLDNISRLMAVLIYSGDAWYWSDFGAYFSSDPIVACMRHAGSGTHATLEAAVMRGDATLMTLENAAEPTVWFNKGSSDLMRCVDQLTGAIGYVDADRLAGTKNYENTHAVKYQGVEPTRETIRNGWYDFWSAQWIYEDPNEPNYAVTNPVVTELMAFASDPANIPSTKADYWSTASEMVYTKGTDWAYPKFTGASNPQTP